MNNFLCFKAVITGITASCVQRMQRTLDGVSAEAMAKIKDFEAKSSIEKNFKTYRSIMDTATPPCIPYLGMYQKDILFLNDGNPSMIGHLINISKRTRIAEVIFDVSFCQMGSFHNLAVRPAFLSWFMNSVTVLNEKELYLWSRRVDPKDPEMVIAELITSEMEFVGRIGELERQLEEARRKIEELEGELKQRKLFT